MEHFFLDFFFDVFEPITSYDAPGEVAETIVYNNIDNAS